MAPSDKMVVVKPVSNAIRILKFLSETGTPARAITIARMLSINASTCFNILRTLAIEDMVEFEPLSKTYTTGVGLTGLVANFLTEGQRVAAVLPHMRDLAENFSVTVALMRRIASDRIILVKSAVSPTNVRIEMAEGQRLPLMMGATGRLFAPHLDLSERELRTTFLSLRWQRDFTFENYWDQVEEAGKVGWAIDDGYFSSGIMSVAVPVYDREDQLVYSIVAVMFRDQLSKGRVDKLCRTMRTLGPRVGSLLF